MEQADGAGSAKDPVYLRARVLGVGRSSMSVISIRHFMNRALDALPHACACWRVRQSGRSRVIGTRLGRLGSMTKKNRSKNAGDSRGFCFFERSTQLRMNFRRPVGNCSDTVLYCHNQASLRRTASSARFDQRGGTVFSDSRLSAFGVRGLRGDS